MHTDPSARTRWRSEEFSLAHYSFSSGPLIIPKPGLEEPNGSSPFAAVVRGGGGRLREATDRSNIAQYLLEACSNLSLAW